MKSTEQGFTLIELMIVVAIIGILAAIALPAYDGYTKRTRVGEGLLLTSAPKASVNSFYNANARFPTSNDEAGLPDKAVYEGDSIKSIEVLGDGRIEVVFKKNVEDDATLILSPSPGDGSMTWSCSQGTLLQKFRPSNCL